MTNEFMAIAPLLELLELERIELFDLITRKKQESEDLPNWLKQKAGRFLKREALTKTICESYRELVLGGLIEATEKSEVIYKPLIELSNSNCTTVMKRLFERYKSDIVEFFFCYEEMKPIHYTVQTSLYLFLGRFIKFDKLTMESEFNIKKKLHEN